GADMQTFPVRPPAGALHPQPLQWASLPRPTADDRGGANLIHLSTARSLMGVPLSEAKDLTRVVAPARDPSRPSTRSEIGSEKVPASWHVPGGKLPGTCRFRASFRQGVAPAVSQPAEACFAYQPGAESPGHQPPHRDPISTSHAILER